MNLLRSRFVTREEAHNLGVLLRLPSLVGAVGRCQSGLIHIWSVQETKPTTWSTVSCPSLVGTVRRYQSGWIHTWSVHSLTSASSARKALSLRSRVKGMPRRRQPASRLRASSSSRNSLLNGPRYDTKLLAIAQSPVRHTQMKSQWRPESRCACLKVTRIDICTATFLRTMASSPPHEVTMAPKKQPADVHASR